MKNILVTGERGYIASAFEKYLGGYPEEYRVRLIGVRDGAWREVDFGEYDAVIHAAAIVHQGENRENADLWHRVNCELTVELAEHAKACGVKQFIFLSTMSVFGMDCGVIDASTVPSPKTSYGRSKLEAEHRLRGLCDEGFEVAIVRPPMVYGKGCKGNYGALRRLALRLPIFPRVENRRSMIHIDNLCEFLRRLADSGEGGVFHPQNAEYVTTAEMARLICEENGRKIRLTRAFNLLMPFARAALKPVKKAFGSLVYDKSLSGDAAAYCTVDFAESIKRTEG